LLIASCEKEAQVPGFETTESELSALQLKNGGVKQDLQDLIAEIEAFVEDGTLNKGNRKALIKHLENAIRAFERGDEEAAFDQLIAFMDQVGAFIEEGKLSEEIGEELLETPYEIVPRPVWQCGDPITDPRDGSVYNTVQIGEQCWFSENLAWLPSVSLSSSGTDTEPYYYVYGYEGIDVTEAMATDGNYGTYGVLYNWPAAMNPLDENYTDACPKGWHLPSDDEWTILTDYLTNYGYGYGGSGSDIGKSMASKSGWATNGVLGTVGNDQESNNSSGFNALPGGNRYYDGGFSYLGYYAYFWSASAYDATRAWCRVLNCNLDYVYRNYYYKRFGFSVRCLKN